MIVLPRCLQTILYLYDRSNTIVLLVQFPVLLLFLHILSVTDLFSVPFYKQEQKTATNNTYFIGEREHEQEQFLILHVLKGTK